MRRLAALALACLAPSLAGAQVTPLVDGQEAFASLVSSGVTGGRLASCFDAGMRMRTSIARVTADDAGEPWKVDVPKSAWPVLNLFADQVAFHIRQSLGAADGALATPPDSVFHFRRLGGHVHLTTYRDGTTRWWLSDDVPGHARWRDTTHRYAERLIGAGIDSVLAQGGIEWAKDAGVDSVAFLLRFSWPLSPFGQPANASRDPLVGAVAGIRVPDYTPVEPGRMGRVRYPEESARAGVRATISLAFQVDTAGRVVPQTVRDVWSADTPRPKGDMARHYQLFVESAKRGLKDTEYKPATLGGCPVPMLVQQPFVFDISR